MTSLSTTFSNNFLNPCIDNSSVCVSTLCNSTMLSTPFTEPYTGIVVMPLAFWTTMVDFSLSTSPRRPLGERIQAVEGVDVGHRIIRVLRFCADHWCLPRCRKCPSPSTLHGSSAAVDVWKSVDLWKSLIASGSLDRADCLNPGSGSLASGSLDALPPSVESTENCWSPC